MKFPSQQIGEFSITAIGDGYLSASLDLLSNIHPTDASRLQQQAGVNDPSSFTSTATWFAAAAARS